MYFWHKLKLGLRKVRKFNSWSPSMAKENHMKANPDKCHLLMATNALTSVIINGFQIIHSIKEKLPGIKFDS